MCWFFLAWVQEDYTVLPLICDILLVYLSLRIFNRRRTAEERKKKKKQADDFLLTTFFYRLLKKYIYQKSRPKKSFFIIYNYLSFYFTSKCIISKGNNIYTQTK